MEEDGSYCLLGIFDIQMPPIYGEGRQKALDRLKRKIQKSSNHAISVSKRAPWLVPFERNPRFTGRESQLAELEGMVFVKDSTTKVAVTGLGGVGKTQLVLESCDDGASRSRHSITRCSKKGPEDPVTPPA